MILSQRKKHLSILNYVILILLIGLTWFYPRSKVNPVEGALPSRCPKFDHGIILGYVQSTLLDEISGIVASRKNNGVLWVHNDSGDRAHFFALNKKGRLLGIYNLQDAEAIDWEDIAIAPDPISGGDYLYLGDTGDNNRSRATITVYRTLEPEVNTEQELLSVELTEWSALPMQFPGSTKFDVETLLVDPRGGDLFLVTRDRDEEGFARVYRNPAPHLDSVLVTLELVAQIPLTEMVKGGDISPSGDAILLRPHASGISIDGLYWKRGINTDLWEVFSVEPCQVPLEDEPQGEAIAFMSDGSGYLTVSEGIMPPIHFYLALP